MYSSRLLRVPMDSSSSHSDHSPPPTLTIPLPPYQGIESLASSNSPSTDPSFNQRAPSPRAGPSARANVPHPYARLYAKKEEVKRLRHGVPWLQPTSH